MTNLTNGIRPFQVWRAPFEYEDIPGVVKHRPVVLSEVRDSEAVAIALKVTGHGPRSEYPGEVPLTGWREAGLTKPSTVRCSKRMTIPLEAFDIMTKYGELTEWDEVAVRDGIAECESVGM